MTVTGCCDKVDITSGTSIVMFGKHRFHVHVSFCKNCGEDKATSYIKHLKEARHDSSKSIPRGKERSAVAG